MGNRFFPNRVLHFILIMLLAITISAPFVFILHDMEPQAQSLVIYSILCAVFLLIVGIVNWRRNVSLLGFYTKRFDSIWLALLIVVIIQLFISAPFNILLNDSAKGINEDSLLVTIGSLTVAPILEETIFRGVLLRGLTTRYSERVSVILSAVLFALIHIHLFQILPGLLLGLLFGVVFVLTHSLLYTIALHFTANLTIFISTQLKVGEFFLSLGKWELVAIGLCALLIATFLTIKLSSRISTSKA